MLFFLLLSGCDDRFADPSREYADVGPESAGSYPTEIHQPTSLGVADTPIEDINGRVVGVGCDTCHGSSGSAAWASSQGNPEDLHQGVTLTHGALSCDSCHEPSDRRFLHLADGQVIAFADTMTLCAQCHGPQYRDYLHGSHGGMSGYWDTSRGPRSRNHCADCHAPHAPAYAPVLPVHPPRDRFFGHTEGEHSK